MSQPTLPFYEQTKRCAGCGLVKSVASFHKAAARADGLQRLCRDCNINLNKQWYRDHPEARVGRMDEYAKARRRELQRLTLEYLREHPCTDCGEADPIVLDFDHLRDKIADVSFMINRRRPWPVIQVEIKKCEVVCANCHRRRTAQRGRTFRFENADADRDAPPRSESG